MRDVESRGNKAARPGPARPQPGAVTTFVDESIVDRAINDVFDSILAVGNAAEGGSYFSARTASFTPGQVIRTFVPVATGAGVRLERSVARLVEYAPYRRLVIAQESPWESRTEIVLTAVGSRTKVSSRTTVPSQTVEQVADMLARGSAEMAEAAPSDACRIALVTSLSGHSSLYGRSTVNCAKLAEQRINAEGGVLGRPVEVVVIDDASSAGQGVANLLSVEARSGLDAAVGVHSSAIAEAIDQSGWALGKPYVYAPLSESSLPQRSLIAVGDTEQDQLELAIPHLAGVHGSGARWVMVGSDFSWPHEVNREGRQLIEAAGGVVSGEFYADAEHPDVEDLVGRVLAAQPDVILSSLVGWGSIEFEEQIFQAGLRARVSSLSLLMDDCSRELLGEAANGIWSVMSYFPGLDSEENRSFVKEYQETYGPLAPPISVLGESSYEALLMLARSANLAGSLHPESVRAHMGKAQQQGPRGSLHMRDNGRVRAPMHLAQATASGWDVLASS